MGWVFDWLLLPGRISFLLRLVCVLLFLFLLEVPKSTGIYFMTHLVFHTALTKQRGDKVSTNGVAEAVVAITMPATVIALAREIILAPQLVADATDWYARERIGAARYNCIYGAHPTRTPIAATAILLTQAVVDCVGVVPEIRGTRTAAQKAALWAPWTAAWFTP